MSSPIYFATNLVFLFMVPHRQHGWTWVYGLMQSVFVILLVCSATSAQESSRRTTANQTKESKKPNIILINLDDAETEIFRDQNMDRFPVLKKLTGQGIRFTNCHTTAPLCAPSRCAMLRGQYAHVTGIRTNNTLKPYDNGFLGGINNYTKLGMGNDDIGNWMQKSGYHTMLVGKFFQGPIDREFVPDGWNDFYSFLSNDYQASPRYDYVDGKWKMAKTDAYRTDLEFQRAMELINVQAKRPKPFFLYLAPLAPHAGKRGVPITAERHRKLWPDLKLSEAASFNEDVSDKPGLGEQPSFSDKQAEFYNKTFRDRMLSILAVDEMLGQLMETLKKNNAEENTYIFFTSDHGYLLGHYRLYGKQYPYNRSTRVPMFVWGPGVAKNTKANHLTALIDVAPTLLELAGSTEKHPVDGKSFARLLKQPDSSPADKWREQLLVENWESTKHGDSVYSSLRMYDSSYIEWASGDKEFYDLTKDPEQIENAYHSLDDAKKKKLAQRLRDSKNPGVGKQSFRPYTTIASLAQNSMIGPATSIKGFAEDDDGVSAVRLSIQDRTNKTYWTGSQWSKEASYLPAKVENENGLLTSWSYQLSIGKGPDQSGVAPELAKDVLIRVMASDNDGWNLDGATELISTGDSVAPTIELTRPRDDDVLSKLKSIGGVASDNHELRDVVVTIKNQSTGKYLSQLSRNGPVTWVDKPVWLSALINKTNGKWHYNVDLPPGDYKVEARSVDSLGNKSKNQPSCTFRMTKDG